ncbi:hypothetical protein ACSSS7_007362 [Eimeria intestinalis]
MRCTPQKSRHTPVAAAAARQRAFQKQHCGSNRNSTSLNADARGHQQQYQQQQEGSSNINSGKRTATAATAATAAAGGSLVLLLTGPPLVFASFRIFLRCSLTFFWI